MTAECNPVQVPNLERLKALEKWLRKTKTKLIHITGQRKYGGPREVWDGPTPGANCEIFICRIPREAYEDLLIPLFSSVGELWEFRLMMDFSGQNRGFAFAKYGSPAIAAEAIRQLNGHVLEPGHRLVVCRSTKKKHLCVWNLPAKTTQDYLLQVLRKMVDGVENVSLRTRRGRASALVAFSSHRAASMAKRVLTEAFKKQYGLTVSIKWKTIWERFPEEPVPEEPVPEEPVHEEPVPEEPVPEEPVPEEPVPEEPVPEDPVHEEPVPEEPVPEEPVHEEPVPEEPVPEEPVSEEPVPEEPVPEEPVPEEPVPKEPVPEEPVHEEPVPEEPVPEEPVSEEPVPEEPVPEKPVPKEPVPEEPVHEEPVPEEPVPEEPVPEEPVPEEPCCSQKPAESPSPPMPQGLHSGPAAPQYPKTFTQGPPGFTPAPVMVFYKLCVMRGFGQPIYELEYSHVGQDGFLYFFYNVYVPGITAPFKGLIAILPGPDASIMLEEAQAAVAQQVLQKFTA